MELIYLSIQREDVQADVLPALACPDCGGRFHIISGTRRHGTGHPEREPAGVMLARSWLRVRVRGADRNARDIPPLPAQRHTWLALDGPHRRRVLSQVLGNRLVYPFWLVGQWCLYMQHRFTTPSFLAARTALGLLQPRDGLILDAPCGMGHFSHYLAKMADPARIVAMDLDPKSAYAARRFFRPNAAAVLV